MTSLRMIPSLARTGRNDPFSASSKVEEIDSLTRRAEQKSDSGVLSRTLHSWTEWDDSAEALSKINIIQELKSLPNVTRAKHFAFEEYGGDSALDLLALPHNAVRHEASQLSMLLMKFQDKPNQYATCREVETLHEWWMMFKGFILELFAVEETVLYERLEKHVELPFQLRDLQRRKTKEKILKSLHEVGKCHALLLKNQIDVVLTQIVDAHSSLSYRLFSYFYDKESMLPKVIRSACTKRDCIEMRTRFLSHFKRQQHHRDNIVLLTRWMSDSQLRSWKAENLPRPLQAMSYSIWRHKIERRESRLAALIVA